MAPRPIFTLIALMIGLSPALAEQGDPALGEAQFRQCRACHMIKAPDGTDIVRGGPTGPNLWGVVGRKAGTFPGFRYSDALIRLGEAGEIWTADDLQAYLSDPNAYVAEKLNDTRARTHMTFLMRKGQADMAAYLAQHGPTPEDELGEAAPPAPSSADPTPQN